MFIAHLKRSHNSASLFFFLILCLLSLFLPNQAVSASTAGDQHEKMANFTLEDFNYTTDQELQGVLVDRSFNVAFPSNWTFETESKVTIHFSHSEALNPTSSMSVDWNGQRVGSTLLTQENANNGTVEINLSPEIINPGYNILHIQFFMGIAEDFCIDYDNPAVWAVVHTSTSFDLSYQEAAVEPELSLAPDLLIDSSLVSQNKITLVVPEDPDLQTFNAMAVAAAKLGQIADWRKIDLNVMTLAEAAQAQPDGDLVVIATIEQIQSFIPDLKPLIASALENYTEGESSQGSITEEDGLVTFQISPYDPLAYALTLTGVSAQAIEKSARATAMNEFYGQSEGQWAVVRSVPQISDHPASTQLSISIEELGLEATTAYGTREQTIQFDFPLSALWDIDSEAWLALHFSHSQLLNEKRSTLNVMINSIPVASIALTSKTANDGYEEVRIPLRYFNIGDNTITLEANMEYRDTRSESQQFCTDDTYPRAWLTIHGDTAIVLPETPEETALSLGNFPYGFTDPFSFKGFAFVIEEGDTAASTEALAGVSLSLGKSLQGNPADIQVIYHDDTLLRDDTFDHLILIGTIPKLLSEKINSALPLVINQDTGLPESTEDILEMDTETGIRSYIQTFEKDQRSFLLITAMQKDGLIAASELISQASTLTGLDGNVAVVSNSENASIYQIEPSESEEQAQSTAQQTTVLNLGNQSTWVVRISVGVAAVSILALLIALIWKNKKSGEA